MPENQTDSVSARIPQQQKTLLEKACKTNGEEVSTFIKRSIQKELARLTSLTDEEKQALGIGNESQLVRKEKYLVVTKVYAGFIADDGCESYQLQEIDMFSRWTDKRPNIDDLRATLAGKKQ
jgi:hypothetical protein